MTALLLWGGISIIFSFLCSIWEAALLSIPQSFIEVKAKEGKSYAPLLRKYKSNIDKPLAGILTLNTLAHTVGAIMVGVSASHVFGATLFLSLPGFDLSYEALIAALMTLAILVFSEIIPKTIGATYWESLAGFTVHSLRIVLPVLTPSVWMAQSLTKLLKKDKDQSVLSRVDIQVMAEIGSKEGVIDTRESTIISNILNFGDIKAKSIMTPRTVVLAEDGNESVEQFYEKHPGLRFSRIPVYKADKDQITGYVLRIQVMDEIIKNNKTATLESIQRDIIVVKEDISIQQLHEQLMSKREHIALVVDEYGGMSGIVTMEDVIETLLGLEILDESDKNADMQEVARNIWKRRAKSLGMIESEAVS